MTKITNAVLAEKMDNMHKILGDDIKPAVKENTVFRIQAKGWAAGVMSFAAFVAGGASWFINWVMKK